MKNNYQHENVYIYIFNYIKFAGNMKMFIHLNEVYIMQNNLLCTLYTLIYSFIVNIWFLINLF